MIRKTFGLSHSKQAGQIQHFLLMHGNTYDEVTAPWRTTIFKSQYGASKLTFQYKL